MNNKILTKKKTMKKLLLLIGLLFFINQLFSQTLLEMTDSINKIFHVKYLTPISKIDTIPCIIIYFECDECPVKATKGYIVQKRYFGELIKYLDAKKENFPFEENVLISIKKFETYGIQKF